MRKYILISTGGILGAISRYLFRSLQVLNYNGSFPLNTLIINITGSFLLALVLTLAFEVWEYEPDIRTAIATGFLGAYTTFSALCKEAAELLYKGDYFYFISYLALSAIFGLGAAYMGVLVTRKAAGKFIKTNNKDTDEALKHIEGEVE